MGLRLAWPWPWHDSCRAPVHAHVLILTKPVRYRMTVLMPLAWQCPGARSYTVSNTIQQYPILYPIRYKVWYVYGFIYSECYEKVTMVRVGWVLPVFNRAELRFLFPSWYLLWAWSGFWFVPCLAQDQAEIPPLILADASMGGEERKPWS